jgi:hypothetical protein
VKNSTTIIAIVVFIFAGLGCQPATNTNTAASSTSNSNKPGQVANANAATAEPANAAPAAAIVAGSLATPSDAYRTAHDLRKRKDVAGLKKIMSPDILEFFTMMGEVEKKSLDEMIKDLCDKPQADKAEVRNEKIMGDMATVEYLTETGSWKTMDFEKIGGEWKLGFPKADKDEIKKTN